MIYELQYIEENNIFLIKKQYYTYKFDIPVYNCKQQIRFEFCYVLTTCTKWFLYSNLMTRLIKFRYFNSVEEDYCLLVLNSSCLNTDFVLFDRSNNSGSTVNGVTVIIVPIVLFFILLIVLSVVFYERNQFGFRDKVQKLITGIY